MKLLGCCSVIDFKTYAIRSEWMNEILLMQVVPGQLDSLELDIRFFLKICRLSAFDLMLIKIYNSIYSNLIFSQLDSI